MKSENIYPTAFRIGLFIQVITLPIWIYNPEVMVMSMVLNGFCMFSIYPLMILWISNRDFIPIESALGPHQ